MLNITEPTTWRWELGWSGEAINILYEYLYYASHYFRLLHLIYGVFILMVSSHVCICPPSCLVPIYEHFVGYIISVIVIVFDLIVWKIFLKRTNYEDPFYACFPVLLLLSVSSVRVFSSTADTFSLSWGHVVCDLMGLIFGHFLFSDSYSSLSFNIVWEENKIILYHIGSTVTKQLCNRQCLLFILRSLGLWCCALIW